MGEAKVRHQNRVAKLVELDWEKFLANETFRLHLEALTKPNAKSFEDWTQQESGQFFRAAQLAARRTAIGPIPTGQGRRAPPPREREHRA